MQISAISTTITTRPCGRGSLFLKTTCSFIANQLPAECHILSSFWSQRDSATSSSLPSMQMPLAATSTLTVPCIVFGFATIGLGCTHILRVCARHALVVPYPIQQRANQANWYTIFQSKPHSWSFMWTPTWLACTLDLRDLKYTSLRVAACAHLAPSSRSVAPMQQCLHPQ